MYEYQYEGEGNVEVFEALATRRSIRKFMNKPINAAQLNDIVEVAKLYPNPANLQPMRFVILNQREQCEPVLQLLRWAGYISDHEIEDDNQPAAMILLFGDREKAKDFGFSTGAAATYIMLAAHAMGIASCCLGVSQASKIYEVVGIDPSHYEFQCLVALGYPGQTARTVDQSGSCKYYLDDQGNFVVPKRKNDEIMLGNWTFESRE